MTWLWCSSRSRIAVATTASPNTVPHSRAVAGNQHAAAFVATRHELEEQMRGIRLERQVSNLIDDQELRLAEVEQPVLEPAFAVRLGELGDERRRGHEQRRIAGQDRLAADR